MAHSTDARHPLVRSICSRNMPHHRYNMLRHKHPGMGTLTPMPLHILTLHLIRIPTIPPTAATMGPTMELRACTSAFPVYSLASDLAADTSAISDMADISGGTLEDIDTRVSSHRSV